MQESLAPFVDAAAAPSSSGRKELERLPTPVCEFPAGVDFDYGDSLDLVTSLGGVGGAVAGAAPELVVDPLASVERVQIRGRSSRVRTAADEDDDDEENLMTPNLHQWAPLDVAPAPNAHKRHRLEETPPDRRLVTKLRRINGHWYVALPNPF